LFCALLEPVGKTSHDGLVRLRDGRLSFKPPRLRSRLMKIAVVEDEEAIADFLERGLRAEGY
jgi:hypothetical protein